MPKLDGGHGRKAGGNMHALRLQDEEEIYKAHFSGDLVTAGRLAEAALLDPCIPLLQRWNYETLLATLPNAKDVPEHLDNAEYVLRIMEQDVEDHPNPPAIFPEINKKMRSFMGECRAALGFDTNLACEKLSEPEDEEISEEEFDSDSEDGETMDEEIELVVLRGQTFLERYFPLSDPPVEAKQKTARPYIETKYYQTTVYDYFWFKKRNRSTKPAPRKEATVDVEDLVSESGSSKRSIELDQDIDNGPAKRTKVSDGEDTDNVTQAPHPVPINHHKELDDGERADSPIDSDHDDAPRAKHHRPDTPMINVEEAKPEDDGLSFFSSGNTLRRGRNRKRAPIQRYDSGVDVEEDERPRSPSTFFVPSPNLGEPMHMRSLSNVSLPIRRLNRPFSDIGPGTRISSPIISGLAERTRANVFNSRPNTPASLSSHSPSDTPLLLPQSGMSSGRERYAQAGHHFGQRIDLRTLSNSTTSRSDAPGSDYSQQSSNPSLIVQRLAERALPMSLAIKDDMPGDATDRLRTPPAYPEHAVESGDEDDDDDDDGRPSQKKKKKNKKKTKKKRRN